MSNLSELIGGGGGGGKTAEFVASGTLPNGQNVILNANGTISLSAQVTATETIPDTTLGTSGQQAQPAYTAAAIITFLPDTPNKFVMFWYDNGFVYNIGTVAGKTVTFSPTTFEAFPYPGAFSASQVEPDPIQPNRLLILGTNSSAYGCFVSALLDPLTETLKFSTVVVLASKASFDGRFSFDPSTTTTSKFAIGYRYRDSAPNYYAAACRAGYMPLTNTAATPTLGTPNIFFAATNKGNVAQVCLGFRPDVAGNFLLTYKHDTPTWEYSIPSAGYYHRGCTVTSGTGTTITLGSGVRFQTNAASTILHKFDPNDTNGKCIVAYMRSLNTNNGICARVLTLSGTSVSTGSEVTVENPPYDKNASINNDGLLFEANTGGVFSFIYHSWKASAEPYHVYCRLGSYSGTTITLQTEIDFPNYYQSTSPQHFGDPHNPGAFIVRSSGGYVGVWHCQMGVPVSNTSTNNYLGITNAEIANGATGEVTMLGGVSETVSSLTPGSDYYVQQNGTLATSSDYPTVKVGRALSATSINLEYK